MKLKQENYDLPFILCILWFWLGLNWVEWSCIKVNTNKATNSHCTFKRASPISVNGVILIIHLCGCFFPLWYILLQLSLKENDRKEVRKKKTWFQKSGIFCHVVKWKQIFHLIWRTRRNCWLINGWGQNNHTAVPLDTGETKWEINYPKCTSPRCVNSEDASSVPNYSNEGEMVINSMTKLLGLRHIQRHCLPIFLGSNKSRLLKKQSLV